MRAAGIIINSLFPGVGSLMIGRTGSGIAQLCLYVVGLILTFSVIGAIIGVPLALAAWIWGLITAATHDEVKTTPA